MGKDHIHRSEPKKPLTSYYHITQPILLSLFENFHINM
jgi:hypothetical protein